MAASWLTIYVQHIITEDKEEIGFNDSDGFLDVSEATHPHDIWGFIS